VRRKGTHLHPPQIRNQAAPAVEEQNKKAAIRGRNVGAREFDKGCGWGTCPCPYGAYVFLLLNVSRISKFDILSKERLLFEQSSSEQARNTWPNATSGSSRQPP
jgi:hypothetical protein